VNWIINRGFYGLSSTYGETYTGGDIQRAIWTLIENANSTSGLGSYSQCRVNEIIAAADAGGDGFEPGCDEYVALIQNPCGNAQSGTAAAFQITMSQIVLDCEDCAPCATVVANTAELTCSEDQSLVSGLPARVFPRPGAVEKPPGIPDRSGSPNPGAAFSPKIRPPEG
jgi:hypothetical protein